MKPSINLLVFTSFISLTSASFAEPWFTGPLLTPAGHTIPKGHTNLEVYGLDITSNGNYNDEGNLIHSPHFNTQVANPFFTHGLTDWMDVQFSLPYVFNGTNGQHSNGIGDVAAGIGLQLLEQKNYKWKPDIRFVFQETIPTGRFENLSPVAAGTDSTGFGSYQSQLALNFQRLSRILDTHYLRTRLSVSHIHYSAVNVHGLNSYGGGVNTNGTISSGEENDAYLAFEFTLTQHWVAVIEGYWSQGDATRFNSIFGIGNVGGPDNHIDRGSYFEEGLAPALEYNFNSNVGLIGGVWFPVKGTNTSHYLTYALALNAYW